MEQPPEETVKFQMGNKCQHNQNNSISFMLLGRQICSFNMVQIETYTPTGPWTQPRMQGDHRMPEAN